MKLITASFTVEDIIDGYTLRAQFNVNRPEFNKVEQGTVKVDGNNIASFWLDRNDHLGLTLSPEAQPETVIPAVRSFISAGNAFIESATPADAE